MSRISGSPAGTLSLTFTSTCAVTPLTRAPLLNSPPAGPPPPRAPPLPPLLCPAPRPGRAARGASCASVRVASAANANTMAAAPRAADLLFDPIMLFGVIMDCAIAFVFFERCTAALFAHDASIFDVNHSVGEAQYTRVVRDHQHPARPILG